MEERNAMKNKELDYQPGEVNPGRLRHDDYRVASKNDLKKAQNQMDSPSKDWRQLANILRRAAGGFSRSRTHRQ